MALCDHLPAVCVISPFCGKKGTLHQAAAAEAELPLSGLPTVPLQVLQEAAAIDAKAAAGQSILPLCGLPLAVKDSIDVLPYPTSAATPALLGATPHLWLYGSPDKRLEAAPHLSPVHSSCEGLHRHW